MKEFAPLSIVGEITRLLFIIRAPLFISLTGAVTLFAPGQIREIFRILAQPARPHGLLQLFFAFIAVFISMLTTWIMGRHLIRRYARDLSRHEGLVGIMSAWIPGLCGALFPLGLATGLFMATHDISLNFPRPVADVQPDLARLKDEAEHVVIYLKCASFFYFALSVFFLIGTYPRLGRINSTVEAIRLRTRGNKPVALFLLFSMATAVTATVAPVAVPQAMGALSLLLIFLSILILIVGSITAYFDRFGVPAILSILALAVLFSAMGWNDNHIVRLETREPASLPSARQALADWLDTRADKDHYSDKPYPVFFVTAAGGGMYAAHHAATVLARLQDRCPNFAQHVFSISGVSGGSLGAAVFASLAKHYAPNESYQECKFDLKDAGPLEQRAQKFFLGADFLAPVVAATLFPDFLQRFLPISFSRFDRARALDTSLVDAWSKAVPEHASDNPFADRFLAHRNDANPGPGLILNATDVEHGYRVAITPFEIVSLGIGNVAPLTKIVEFHSLLRKPDPNDASKFDQDLSLATAVGLSARFPWILPAGRLINKQHDIHMVDGGYMENSGAETTLDLLRSLHTSYRGLGPRKISVHIIAISSIQLVEAYSWQGVAEILSPLRTMLSTRDSRGSLAIYHASTFPDDCLADVRCNKASGQFTIFPLNLLDFPIPLGWQLSPISSRLISLHSGRADQVNGAAGGSIVDETRDTRIFAYINTANESSCTIQKILGGPRSSDNCTSQ